MEGCWNDSCTGETPVLLLGIFGTTGLLAWAHGPVPVGKAMRLPWDFEAGPVTKGTEGFTQLRRWW